MRESPPLGAKSGRRKAASALRKTATTLLMLVRVTGLFQLILGILFWSGSATSLIPLHITVGILFVLALLGLAVLALRAAGGLATASIVWGVVVAVLGFTQTGLVPGAAHWVIQVLHLLVGIAAIGLGETLGGRLRRAAQS